MELVVQACAASRAGTSTQGSGRRAGGTASAAASSRAETSIRASGRRTSALEKGCASSPTGTHIKVINPVSGFKDPDALSPRYVNVPTSQCPADI